MSVGTVDKTTGDAHKNAGMPVIDSVLSGTSTNPVQNKVVKEALDIKQDAINYSTTEQKTGQKWIDGKDIYRKVTINVDNETIIATNVDTIVNCIISRHGTSSDNNRYVFGDGFTVNDGGSIYFDSTTHTAQYAVWASAGGNLDKVADHIIIEYTKTT